MHCEVAAGPLIRLRGKAEMSLRWFCRKRERPMRRLWVSESASSWEGCGGASAFRNRWSGRVPRDAESVGPLLYAADAALYELKSKRMRFVPIGLNRRAATNGELREEGKSTKQASGKL